MIEATKNQPVDVQMGKKLYEDAPQDLRTRLWCVLLESPDLGEVFRVSHNYFKARIITANSLIVPAPASTCSPNFFLVFALLI